MLIQEYDLCLAFYGFLHCWLNAFAEMLRFADRQFYSVRFFLTSERMTLEMISSRIGGQQLPGVVIIEHGIS